MFFRGHTLCHQGREQIVRRECGEQLAIGRLVRASPDVRCAFRHLKWIEQRLVRELGRQAHAFAAVVVRFAELCDAGAVTVEFRRERRGPEVPEITEKVGENSRVILLAFGREGDGYKQ